MSARLSFSLLIVLVLVLLVGCLPRQEVCFDLCFSVEIPSSLEFERGLMYRTSLSAGSGMLFIFPEEGIYPFWMKNMNFPIDIVWINSSRHVVFIERNALPCSKECPNYDPGVAARYVLEVNPGMTSNVKIGSLATFYLE